MTRADAVSAVIPNRDGAELLRRTLPPLLRELSTREHEILVVDDASEDESVAMLQQEFPTVRVIAHDRNIGFGAACNLGFRAASSDLVLLLNSDMVVVSGSIARLLEHFGDPQVFAAGPRYATPGETLEPADDGYGMVRPQLGSPAGGGLFRRELYLELGGFDPLYAPFYWEDLDLGWAAWRAGHRILRDARVCFVHLESATIRRLYSPGHVNRVKSRNRCFFGWKNLSSVPLLVWHAKNVARQAVTDLCRRGTVSGLLGVVEAVANLPRVLAHRPAGVGLSDTEIIGRAGATAQRLFSL